MAETPSNNPQATELVDIPLVPRGGEKINTHVQNLQNRRFLPMADLISRQALWGLECDSSNVGATVTPGDSKNTQKFLVALTRAWTRAKKFNNSHSGSLEFSHPVRFMTLQQLQDMPNTPFRQLNYLLWHFFQLVLGQEGARLQTFIDGSAIEQIDAVMEELTEFIGTELGDGAVVDRDQGTFATGAGMPSYGRLGRLTPTPLTSNIHVDEPSAATPPEIPSDSADR